MIRVFLVTILLIFSGQEIAFSRPIISGISTNEINIDSNFTGQKILLFGAKGDVGEIVIVVRGPKRSYIVNKKAEILGIWHNQKRVKFDDVYSYYSLFSTSSDLGNKKLLRNLQIGKGNIDLEQGRDEKSDINFRLQLIDKMAQNNLYSENKDPIDFLDETLFKVMLDFPKNIAHGDYLVEIYLIDEGNVAAYQAIPIYVHQVGFSARVNNMAHHQSFLYAVIAIFLAVSAGFLANSIFNRLFK